MLVEVDEVVSENFDDIILDLDDDYVDVFNVVVLFRVVIELLLVWVGDVVMEWVEVCYVVVDELVNDFVVLLEGEEYYYFFECVRCGVFGRYIYGF